MLYLFVVRDVPYVLESGLLGVGRGVLALLAASRSGLTEFVARHACAARDRTTCVCHWAMACLHVPWHLSRELRLFFCCVSYLPHVSRVRVCVHGCARRERPETLSSPL